MIYIIASTNDTGTENFSQKHTSSWLTLPVIALFITGHYETKPHKRVLKGHLTAVMNGLCSSSKNCWQWREIRTFSDLWAPHLHWTGTGVEMDVSKHVHKTKTNTFTSEPKENTSAFSPCSSLCCRCLETCQSLRSSPPGPRPPGSCVLPGHGGRSAAMPGRPCLRRSVRRCAASEAEWADPAGASWTPPGYGHQGRELCRYRCENCSVHTVHEIFT